MIPIIPIHQRQMIFIHTRLTDITTIKVVQWLINLDKDFFRFNTAADMLNELTFDVLYNNGSFRDAVYGRHIDIRSFDSFYFNNGYFIYRYDETPDRQLNEQISKHLSNEVKSFFDHFYGSTQKKKQFGKYGYETMNLNKLYVLKSAEGAGLKTPLTAIVSTKKALLHYKKIWGRIVTKNIDYGIDIKTDNLLISGQKTEEITDDIIARLDENFSLTLIQQLIEKKYEVRVFYFNGRINAIAVFNPRHIDSRSDDRENPIRKVPYTLPENIETKICTLMKSLQLNYGSIDLICTKVNTFFFLEVNPFGQYGFLSAAGNFYLEKEIATYL